MPDCDASGFALCSADNETNQTSTLSQRKGQAIHHVFMPGRGWWWWILVVGGGGGGFPAVGGSSTPMTMMTQM